MWPNFVFSCILVSILLPESCVAKQLEFPHANRTSLVLNHLVLDHRTGTLYVGAVNRLFQLNGELEVMEEVTTGPRLDHVRCTTAFGDASCGDGGTVWYSAVETNNANKVLVLDYENNRLITCGTIFQGTCQARPVTNLSFALEPEGRGNTDYFIAANNVNQSTVAFTGPGPDDQNVLYVASTYTGTTQSTVRQAVPAVSSRILTGSNLFRFTYFDGLTGGTAIHLRREAVEKYQISYIAGFTADNYSYFLTNQPESFSLENTGTPPLISENHVSKLIQVCNRDRKFYSYAEIPLLCRSAETEYNLVQSVALIQPSDSSTFHRERVLVAAFARSEDGDVPSPAKNSAVCLYRLSDVRKIFAANVQRCFSAAQKLAGMQFSNRLCTLLNFNITETYCGEAEQNGPLVGTIPLESSPVMTFDELLLTSVAATYVNDHMMLFLGSSDGYLTKVALQSEMKYHIVDKVLIDPDSPINRDLHFDPSGSYFYSLTKSKVVRLPVSNCEVHSTCESCRSLGDPYCGWCSLEKRCTSKALCVDSHLDKRWLAYDSWDCIGVPSQFVNPTKIGIRRSVQCSAGAAAAAPTSSTAAAGGDVVDTDDEYDDELIIYDFHHKVIGMVKVGEGTWMMLRQFGAFHFGLIGASAGINEAAVMDYVTSSFLSVSTSLHSLAVTPVRHSDLSQALHLALPPVTIGIKSLPPLHSLDKYLCLFGSANVSTVGMVAPNEIRCQTPQPALRNFIAIIGRADHMNVTLSIYSTATNTSFVETVLTFYNCSQHISCTLCTSALWGCHWCVQSNVCSQSDELTKCTASTVSRPEMCPQLRHQAGVSMIIAANIPMEIRIPATHLPIPINPVRGYQCIIHLTAPPVLVSAKRISSEEVICDAYEYSYEPQELEKVASVEVIWNKDFYIDDFYGVSVTIYKCEVLATDCSTCLSLQEVTRSAKYNCQWCNSRCQHNSTCGQEQTRSCPLPNIHDVYPLSGPLEGGTLLTITGTNLGRSIDHIHHSIFIADVPCEVIPSEYIVSRRIVCKTGPVSRRKQARIVVTIGDATVSWEMEFKYQKPDVVSVSPRLGPMAGGTAITFHGYDLDTGGFIQILFDFVPCKLDRLRLNSTAFVCTTVPVLNTMVLPIAVIFDEVTRRIGQTFEYTDNPTILDINPLTSFASGGRIITITGTSFGSVGQAFIHLSSGVSTFNSSCSFVNNSTFTCSSPRIRNETLSAKHLRVDAFQEFGDYEVWFTMDGVVSVHNMSLHFPDVKSTFTIVPDPEFIPFEGGQRVYRGEALILGGENLNLACTPSEVMVFIGAEMCRVNSLDVNTLYCTPPVNQPQALDSYSLRRGSLPIVKVVVGNFIQVLGELEYQGSMNSINEYWVIGIGVGGGALFTVVVIILVVYKRKSSEAVRQFRKLQFHLNTLEINIRNECKQAFAELQTEVSDFTSDLNVIGIPFWDYKTFSHNILFPAHPDYSVLRCDMKTRNGRYKCYDDRLQEFKQLLNCSQFLLVFIHTLEEQKNFSIKDRSIFASLLVIVLHDRMDYITEILKALLNDLIDHYVEKRHAKLMLRRTESVAEKLLTNWLTLCMYDHLREHSGKALFMLYKAIKHQTEKGPVDVITSDARYALTEYRLLQQKIETRVLVVNLVDGGNFPQQEPTTCKMLDCDTITQAKEKALDAIYLNTPFSCRPSVLDVDLEWGSPGQGVIVLHDDDLTTATNKGWQKINTLGHYRIPDGATLAVIPKRKQDLNPQMYTSMDINSHSPVSSTTPFFVSEEGSKFYHLVKHDDSQNSGRVQKVISEVFLTRLLATKCTLQQYIDDLFTMMLCASSCLPPAIKYLFDFLDSSAARHNIIDPEVIHIWKSNSLPLRFWVSLMKNPEFVFDINKSVIIESCLSTIAQTLMDTCSTQTQTLSKDSPSTKLLFAKDIPRYRQMLAQFYHDVQDLPSVTDEEMSHIMIQHSQAHVAEFNIGLALRDLYKYASEYNYELLEAFDNDSVSRKLRLGDKFEQACKAVEGANFY